MSKSKVLFLMTGSIACYKACQVVSRLVQNDCEVQVVATPAALQFIGNATIEGLTGKSIVSDLYAPGSVMDHIHLVRWADLILVAPATANFINKAAAGIGDDLVSTLFLAHDFKKPFLLAPAMNTMMYQHPTTQASLKKLADMGVELLDTAAGILACGEEGYGRLLEPTEILQRTLEALKSPHAKNLNAAKSANSVHPKKILITAGGTQEPIDSVRVITNLSSGRTGAQLARQFTDLGCDVTLLRAENAVKGDVDIRQKTFKSFADLDSGLKDLLSQSDFDAVIHAAAVSDYSVVGVEYDGKSQKISSTRKLTSEPEHLTLQLKKNFKIVERLKSYSRKKDLKVIGFKLTSHATPAEREAAAQKVLASTDYVVHNDLAEIDGAGGRHDFTLYAKNKKTPCSGLEQLAGALSQALLEEKT